MKNRLLLLILFVFSMAILSAQTKAPDYQKTLSELSKLEQKRISNPDLFYNIGVCQAHLGNESKAVVYFLRALNLDSAHSASRHNLDYIISLSPDQDMYPQRQFIGNLMLNIYHWFNLNRIALALLLMLLLTSLSLHWLLHYPRDKERGLPVLLAVLSAFLLLCVVIGLGTKVYRQQFNHKAVVQAAVLQIYAEPDAKTKSVRSLHQSLIVELSETKGDWCRINLPNGMSGWVKTQGLLRVSP